MHVVHARAVLTLDEALERLARGEKPKVVFSDIVMPGGLDGFDLSRQAELIRPAIERLDGRVCVSEACIGSLAPYYPYAYDVIPNGIDADHFSPDAETDRRCARELAAGRTP